MPYRYGTATGEDIVNPAGSSSAMANPWYNPYMPGPDIGRGMMTLAAILQQARADKEAKKLAQEKVAEDRRRWEESNQQNWAQVAIAQAAQDEAARKSKAAEQAAQNKWKLPEKTKKKIAEYYDLPLDEIDQYPPEFQQRLAERFTEGVEKSKLETKTKTAEKAARDKEAFELKKKDASLRRQMTIMNTTNTRLEALKTGLAKTLAGIEAIAAKTGGYLTDDQTRQSEDLKAKIANLERAQLEMQGAAQTYLAQGVEVPGEDIAKYSGYLNNIQSVLNGDVWKEKPPAQAGTYEPSVTAEQRFNQTGLKLKNAPTQAATPSNAPAQETRVVNGMTYYKHKDGKWYTAPEKV